MKAMVPWPRIDFTLPNTVSLSLISQRDRVAVLPYTVYFLLPYSDLSSTRSYCLAKPAENSAALIVRSPARSLHLGKSSSRLSLPPRLVIRLSTVSGLSKDCAAVGSALDFAADGAVTVVDAALVDVRIDFRAVIRIRQSLHIQGRSGANMLLLMI